MNLRKWIETYYTMYKKFDLKAGTIDAYLRCLCRVPDDWNVEDVTREKLQLLINVLADELAASTVKHVFTIIREPLLNAHKYGYNANVDAVSNIRLPAQKKKAVKSLTAAEQSAIADVLQESDYADIYIMLLNTGLRFCELAGLNVGDVDFQNKTISIERNKYRGYLYNTTKTQAGIRVVPLNFAALSVCRRQLKVGSCKNPLFLSKRGLRLSYNTVVHDWHKLLESAGIAKCGLHVLRHTFATNLLASNVSLKVASALLGHESIAITADIYMDVPLDLKKQAVDCLKFGA